MVEVIYPFLYYIYNRKAVCILDRDRYDIRLEILEK